MASDIAIHRQSAGEPDFHTHPIWYAKSALGIAGYSDRVEYDHLDDAGHLETLPLGGSCSNPVFHLGFDCDSAAIEHDLDELGKIIS